MPLLFIWCRQPDSIFILLPVEQNKGVAPSSRRQRRSSAPHLDGFESVLFHITYKSTPGGDALVYWCRQPDSNRYGFYSEGF